MTPVGVIPAQAGIQKENWIPTFVGMTMVYSHSIGGKTIEITLTDWAEQASGAVLARLGDTMVLATAVMSPTAREGIDFFPLTVEYEEKYYATGKILGSRFIKRETRPSEEAVLAGRAIDRSIRPRFDMRMRNEVQVVVTVFSIDEENDPDVLGLIASSLALGLSDIPWSGPIAGVRISRKDGAFMVNPTYQERLGAELDVMVSGTKERINMIEAGANEAAEDVFHAAVIEASGFIGELIAFLEEIIREHGRAKRTVRLIEAAPELNTLLKQEFSRRIETALYQNNKKISREDLSAVREEWHQEALARYPNFYQKDAAELVFDEEINSILHRRILDKGERPDGRSPEELRPLSASIGVLPRVHGSGLFMRGETHVLSTLTLGAPGDEQIIEGMEIRTKRHFLHHYNFPPYSTGEVKPMRGPGRREIGHGALAGRAILPLLPTREEFPYTIRIVSEALSSNGSTSMASVSGSSLALMDGGAPIKKAVAGAAMGLIIEQLPVTSNQLPAYKVLTDIQGPEDHHGDMDFKVAGTRDGITAVQMDVKIEGITPEMLSSSLKQAREARLKILDVMDQIISAPRPELSPWAPRIQMLKINPEKIGALIGPGGKVINDIIAQTQAQIDIEDDGTVFITSVTAEGMQKAIELVKQITREIKPGELVEGKVTRIFEFGAMVEVGPRQEGLIHISELAPWRVDKVTDIVKPGETVQALVKNIDEQGRINLSLKEVPGRYSDAEIERGRMERPPSPRPSAGDWRRPRRPMR